MKLQPTAESKAFADLVRQACVKASLQIMKIKNTVANINVTPELALVLAMVELTPETVDVTPAMRDAGANVLCDARDAYDPHSDTELSGLVFKAMVAAREGSI